MQYNTDMAEVGARGAMAQQGEGKNLRKGYRVELTGLSSEDLNGQRGSINGPYIADRERWPVAIDGSGRELSCKPTSLKGLASCAHCGAEKVFLALKQCTRCRAVHYCNGVCQRAHWKRGGHKQACREQFACTICLDYEEYPLPIQCGCGCRLAAGSAHVACKAEYAAHQGPGNHAGWGKCSTCKQDYTGAMRLGLFEAVYARMRGRPAEDDRRLMAQGNLATAFMEAGRYAQAKALYQDLLATRQRVNGPNDTSTLFVAANLGRLLANQLNHSEAETMFRDILEKQQESLGPEHEDTLGTAFSLAGSLQNQYKYAEAEPLLRKTLAIQQRVFGKGHILTLTTANGLAVLLFNTGQHADAEELSRGALAQANRTLGHDHPDSLDIACTLANALGTTAEAETLLKDALATRQRLLGPEHPITHDTAQWLQRFQ